MRRRSTDNKSRGPESSLVWGLRIPIFQPKPGKYGPASLVEAKETERSPPNRSIRPWVQARCRPIQDDTGRQSGQKLYSPEASHSEIVVVSHANKQSRATGQEPVGG